MSSNLPPQQKQEPVDLTSHGRIARRVCSHVTPEVFFGAGVDGEDEEAGQGAEHQVMVKPGPGAAFKMVEPEIVFGALEVLFDMPATAAECQATRFGGRTMQVGQIVVIRFGGLAGQSTTSQSCSSSPPALRKACCNQTSHQARRGAPRSPPALFHRAVCQWSPGMPGASSTSVCDGGASARGCRRTCLSSVGTAKLQPLCLVASTCRKNSRPNVRRPARNPALSP